MNNLNWIQTEDGSYSAYLSNSEAMHHTGGAWGETLYIYGEVLKHLVHLREENNCRCLIVGLGLGYIEWMIIATFAKKGLLDRLTLDSYESDPKLFSFWNTFFKEQKIERKFQVVLSTVAKNYNFSNEKLIGIAKELIQNSKWNLNGDIKNIKKGTMYDGIFYDPFSKKTNPELWSEEFLNYLIKNFSSKKSIFGTYSSKGVLKRALKSNNFHLIKKKGFKGKRESTLAVRNL